MRIWKARLIALLTTVAMLVTLSAPVALADDDCKFRERGKKDDVFVCRDNGEREIVEVDDIVDFDDHNDLDIDADFDNAFLVSPFILSPFFFVEEIDVDCDEIDDDLDGLIDEGAICEVELEFFGGEDVDLFVEEDELF